MSLKQRARASEKAQPRVCRGTASSGPSVGTWCGRCRPVACVSALAPPPTSQLRDRNGVLVRCLFCLHFERFCTGVLVEI